MILELLILPDGKVGEVRVKKSSGFKRLDKTAMKAVKRWRYLPAKRGDEAISYWYLQPLEFSLNQSTAVIHSISHFEAALALSKID